jgi:hypothetical protein
MLPIILASGDYNASGQVEQADLDLVLLHWGQDGATVPAGWTHELPSGMIDQEELDRVLINWGDASTVGAAAAAVPEPEAWILALATFITALAARRFTSAHPSAS